MMDKGHRYTDKQIELLEKRLRRHYGKVSKDIKKKLTDYLKQNKDRYEELWRALDEGEITTAQFEYLLMSDNGLDAIEGDITDVCVEGDANAMVLVGTALGAIFAYNSNFQGQKMQLDIGKINGLIGRIKRRNRMLPPPNPDKMKDRIWHRVKIRLVVRDGLRHGRNIYDISQNLERVTNMDTGAAIRAARTACTNAENQGKLEAMYVLRDEYGVDVKKMWYATLDNRTRTQHREMHGEIRELEEPFSNGLQYPADPNGDPSEVWNCRCTLLDVLGETDISKAPRGMTHDQWLKKKPVSKPYPIPKSKR